MSLSRKNPAQCTRHPKKPQHHSKIILLAVALLVAVALHITAIRYFSHHPVFATVNGETIYATNVDSEIARLKKVAPKLFTKKYGNLSTTQLRKSLLDSLINEKLLTQEARRRNLKVNSTTLHESKTAIRSKFASQEEYQRFLSKSGITADQLSEALTSNLLVAELANNLVSEKDITDTEARTYFEAHKAKYATITSKRAAQILFAPGDMKTATSVRREIASGADFATLAKKYSKDTGSAVRSGDLGWSTSVYPPAFQAALDALNVGEVSQPVTTEYGIHLIKLLEVREGSARFEEARGQVIADLLGEKRAAALDALLMKLRADAKIEQRGP